MGTYVVTDKKKYRFFFINLFAGNVIAFLVMLFIYSLDLGGIYSMPSFGIWGWVLFFIFPYVSFIASGHFNYKLFSCPYLINVHNDRICVDYKEFFRLKYTEIRYEELILFIDGTMFDTIAPKKPWARKNGISIRNKKKRALLYMSEGLWDKDVMKAFANDLIDNHHVPFIINNGQGRRNYR